MQKEIRSLISLADKSVLNTEGLMGIAGVGSFVRVHLKGTLWTLKLKTKKRTKSDHLNAPTVKELQ